MPALANEVDVAGEFGVDIIVLDPEIGSRLEAQIEVPAALSFEGRQHNTYDIEFYGPNPLCSGYYLAALRAVEELAMVMDNPELAGDCREIFENGRHMFDVVLWNGEYYQQQLDNLDAYRYQHGEGCLSDQLLGLLHADLLCLDPILPAEHIHKALQSIHRYNFKPDLSQHTNCQRTFALGAEAGLVLCSWPRGGQPQYPFPYSDEVWTGIEYHVAAHLMQAGEIEAGLEMVQAVRARHDGFRRSPWDEVECGHHYARSMSAWTLLLALSGLQADAARGILRFEPLLSASTREDLIRLPWSNGLAWGVYQQQFDSQRSEITSSGKILGGNFNTIIDGELK